MHLKMTELAVATLFYSPGASRLCKTLKHVQTQVTNTWFLFYFAPRHIDTGSIAFVILLKGNTRHIWTLTKLPVIHQPPV